MSHSKLRLPIGFATLFVVGTDLFVVSPLLPLIARDLNVGVGAAAATIPVFSAAYLVASPAMGRLADHHGHRRVLLMGMTTFAAANFLTGLAPALWVLLAARVLTGTSAAAITPSLYALTGSQAPQNRRGTWLAILGSGLLSALAAGSPVGSLVADASGWRPVFIALAVLTLLLIAPERLVWPARIETPPAQTAARPVGMVTRMRAVSVTAFWGAAVYGFYTYLGSQLRAGFTASAVAGILVIYGVCAVAGSITGGRLADYIGARPTATGSLIAITVCQAALAAGWSITPLVIAGLGALVLTGYVCFPAHQARLVSRFPQQRASILAWNNSALYTGILAGSAIDDVILSVAGFRAVLVLCVGLAIVGATASWTWSLSPASPSASAPATGDRRAES